MKRYNKVYTYLILMIGALIIGGYCLFTTHSRPKLENKLDEEIKNEERIETKLIKELADKYQATTDWQKELHYTYQVQERLITGKPILFKGRVDDVFHRHEKTFIRFSYLWLDFESSYSWASYIFELECDKHILDFLSNHKQGKGEYAVVANVQEVSRPIYKLEGDAVSEEEAEIKIDTDSPIIAKGILIDIAYVKERTYKRRY